MNHTEHFVQFYESVEFLAASVTAHVLAGFETGDSCVVVARKDSITEIEKQLTASGVDVADMADKRRFIVREAGETLSHFIVKGVPQASLFAEHMGSVIEQAPKTGEVRVFGELVAQLVQDNNTAACWRLEELWNELLSSYSFTLCCAYPSAAFAEGADLDSILRACGMHTEVLRDEHETVPSNAEDRLKDLSYLQQWNEQLLAELEELEKRIAQRRGSRN